MRASLSVTWRALPLLLLGAPLLGSCGPDRTAFAPPCPAPALVRPLAELSRFRPGSRDQRDLVVHARVYDITGVCKFNKDGSAVDTDVQVSVEAVRGPAFDGDSMGLPVFIAVTLSDDVRDKKLFTLPIRFEGNVDSVRAQSQAIHMVLPVSANLSSAAYGVVAGFQLSPEEVDTARQAPANKAAPR
jgi:hypothetical protein